MSKAPTWEGLALAYKDGTFTPLMEVRGGSMSIDDARKERKEADKNEEDSDQLTDIVRVRIEVLEIVERFRGCPINIDPLREIINAQAVVGLIDHAKAEPLYNAIVKALKANGSKQEQPE